jgi:hypothetical protein
MTRAYPACAWSGRKQRLVVALLVLILLVAAALRLWALDVPALWWDEGNNAYFALQSPARLLEMSRLTHDTDPPAHRLVLGLWLHLAGASAYNLRLLSALLGVATVALIFAWGQWVAGARVGLLAALLMALSPMAVYYSREAKGYPFVAFFGLLALYLWARHLHDQEHAPPLLWAAYVLCSALSVGAHYYAVFLIVAQGVWLASLALFAGPERPLAWRRMRRWFLAQVAVAALLSPWVWLTWSTAASGARGVAAPGTGPLGVWAYLKEVFLGLSAGPIERDWAAFLAMGVLAAAALWRLAHGRCQRIGLLGSIVFVPMVLSFFVQARFAFFSARFLLYDSGPLFILAAHGLLRLRRVGVALGALLALAWAVAFPSAYTLFKGPEEDLRPLAQTLRERAEPGDGVLVGYIWQEGILRMYAPEAPVSYHLDWLSAETRDDELRQLLTDHPRLWLVTYGAPLQHEHGNPTGWWLEQHAIRALVSENGPERAVLYLSYPEAKLPRTGVTFEQGIGLGFAPLSSVVSPGGELLVPLRWELSVPISQAYGVFVHLSDLEETKVWAQHDGDPVNSLRPFSLLAPGEPITDCHVLWLPAEVPPGSYKLTVGLYDRDTGRRLIVVNGPERGANRCTVGEVEVRPG